MTSYYNEYYDDYDKFPIIRYEKEIGDKLYISFYNIYDI